MAKGAQLIIRISGDSLRFRNELKKLERQSNKTTSTISANARRASEARIRFAKRAALVVGTLAAVGIGRAIKDFAEFEQGLAGVSKTTNIVGKDLENLGRGITSLSIELGTSSSQLLLLARTAGQLGVEGSKNILKFTRVLAGLEKTTNIVGEQGAIALARLIKITGEAPENVDRLASAIVGLGNETAALENQILFTATEIAGAGSIFGVTAKQALGLAAAFSELAVRPEIARTVVNRAFNKIGEAIVGGGKKLQRLIAITEMTEEQLRKTFQENSPEIFRAFLVGLKKINDAGEIGALTKELKAFGLSGLRLEPNLAKLALGAELVGDKLNDSNKFYKSNIALIKELNTQLDTTQSRALMVKEEYAAVSRELGEQFIPLTEDALTAMKDVAPFIKDKLVPALGFLITFLGHSARGMGLLADETIKAFEKINNNKAFKKFLDFTFLPEIFSGITAPFSAAAITRESEKELEEIQKKRAVARKIRQTRENIELAEHLEQKAEIEKDANENTVEEDAEIAAAKADVIAADREAKLEKQNEEREEKLEKDQEEFDEDIELLEERLELAGLINDEDALNDIGREIEKTKEIAKNRGVGQAKIIKDEIVVAKAQKKIDAEVLDNKLGLGLAIVQAAGINSKAVFLIEKAVAIARSIITTNLAFNEALANPPGPPETFPIAAAARLAGRLSTATIIATAIGGIGSAQDGGIVGGGFGGGDRVPFLLERGEVIVPSQLNPLNPNFEDTFGDGGGGLGGSQRVEVVIDLTEDASQILTVAQREDSTLGVQT